MVGKPNPENYWPLGAIDYSHEVIDSFPDEAMLLGVVTILWNRQEIALKRLFLWIIRAKSEGYAEAIWDRMQTHKARRDTLEMAIEHGKLTKRQRGILKWVVDQTKTMADRRNELAHAEYVVGHQSERLHARVKSPNSKNEKHQPLGVSDLKVIVRDLDFLVQATEAACLEFHGRKLNRLMRELEQFAKDRRLQP